MNKKVIVSSVLVVLLLVSHVFLVVKIFKLKEAVSCFQKRTEEFEKTLTEFQKNDDLHISQIDLQISQINERIMFLLNSQEENKAEMINEITRLYQISNAQYSKTVVMSKTYDAILEEQKKKTVDTAEKDTSNIESKKKALDLYKKGNYAAAYDELNKLVQVYTEDMEIRLYKVKSLYYRNRADSSSYAEILDDIKILNLNGAVDGEILAIEKSILVEKEGFNE